MEKAPVTQLELAVYRDEGRVPLIDRCLVRAFPEITWFQCLIQRLLP